MSKNEREEEGRWDDMDNGVSQEQLQIQLDLFTDVVAQYGKDQQVLARYVEATGPAVAQFTLDQM